MTTSEKKDTSTDEDIRSLVLARLKTTSPDTIKCIGSAGTFSRDELIEHVENGDEIGRIIEDVEMSWLRAMKEGIVGKLYS